MLEALAKIILVLGAIIFVALIASGFYGHDFFELKGLPVQESKRLTILIAGLFLLPGFGLLKISKSRRKIKRGSQ